MKLYRPATILVGLLFVLLGGITRLAGPDHVYGDDQNLKVVHGTIGEALPFAGSGSTMKVTRIKFAKTIIQSDPSDDDKPFETNGVFIAVEWDAVRGVKDPDSFDPVLITDGGSVYTEVSEPSESRMEFPDAGFASTGAVVFEANPADLKGLTLRMKPSMIFNVYNSEIRVDLGIPTEDIAQQMVDGAVDQYVVNGDVTRVAS
ncbi:hypothetical protein [Kribbella sindirgiensis]|uniref:DUF4352 domain-containing protein n=1 Tax=Kribbella sindirgiensis TaxID=1124744 RepID=A0A4R0JCA6_9ACTN|nr:hypothetical protein [Kribbella sindirgiensis]TCC43490.1 hypothetical protein E0H50_03240 [Kribbella sindirgiensis]